MKDKLEKLELIYRIIADSIDGIWLHDGMVERNKEEIKYMTKLRYVVTDTDNEKLYVDDVIEVSQGNVQVNYHYLNDQPNSRSITLPDILWFEWRNRRIKVRVHNHGDKTNEYNEPNRPNHPSL